MTEGLRMEYIDNLLSGNDDAVKQIRATIRDEFDDTSYEVSTEFLALVPKDVKSRERIMFQTILGFIRNWRKDKRSRDLDWDLICAMSKLVQTLIYYNNCATRNGGEIVLQDLLEIQSRVETTLAQIERSIQLVRQHQQEK